MFGGVKCYIVFIINIVSSSSTRGDLPCCRKVFLCDNKEHHDALKFSHSKEKNRLHRKASLLPSSAIANSGRVKQLLNFGHAPEFLINEFTGAWDTQKSSSLFTRQSVLRSVFLGIVVFQESMIPHIFYSHLRCCNVTYIIFWLSSVKKTAVREYASSRLTFVSSHI